MFSQLISGQRSCNSTKFKPTILKKLNSGILYKKNIQALTIGEYEHKNPFEANGVPAGLNGAGTLLIA